MFKKFIVSETGEVCKYLNQNCWDIIWRFVFYYPCCFCILFLMKYSRIFTSLKLRYLCTVQKRLCTWSYNFKKSCKVCIMVH